MFVFLRNLLSSLVLALSLLISGLAISEASSAQDKISFWATIKRGTNVFNKSVERETVKAAKDYGLQFIRLSPARFPSKGRDFLIGNADEYVGLVEEDVKALRSILDMCAEEDMSIVLTMLGLPGLRWTDSSWWEADNVDDQRLWDSPEFQMQAAQFWKDLAAEFHDHPAIVGFNLLNEPALEKRYTVGGEGLAKISQEKVQKELFEFYALLIKTVRSVAPDVPIILDSSAYAEAEAFEFFKPHDDDKVLYAFHVAEPFEYTSFRENKGKYEYPGKINGKLWNSQALKDYLQSVVSFQKRYDIPSNRILAGEFGADRRSRGVEIYLRDLVEIFDARGWHNAFYAFRTDSWHGRDYELGSGKMPWSYWKALEKGEKPKLNRSAKHPAFKALLKPLGKTEG